MPNFQYKALNARGEEANGTLQANDQADAIQQLRGQGLYPTQVDEAGSEAAVAAAASAPEAKGKKKSAKQISFGGAGRVKPKVLMIFTRQLATLIDAGLPLLRSLNVLGKQEPNPALKKTINSLAESVQTGATFSESLAQHPKVFNKLFINMVKAGELGGVLEVVLTRLAEYMEKADKLKNKIVSAMVYPVIVLFIAVAILIFLMIFIVPKFKDMFSDQGATLPLISRMVFGTSEFMLSRPLILPNIAWMFVVIGGLLLCFKAWGNTKAGRAKVDAFKLKVPIFGDLIKKGSISRFSRTLGTLVTSGVPILQALTITRDTSGNVLVSKAIDEVHAAVKEGESIVAPLKASPIFPPMVISMVDVGEETGQLPEMLLKIADVYDDEVDNAVTAFTSIIEPVMIVFLALIVGTIVMALFLPLIKMISNVDQQV